MELKKRSEVDVKETWDLSLIFKTEGDYERAVETIKKTAEELETFRGKLNHPAEILACLDRYGAFLELVEKCGAYADLAVEVDYYDTKNQERSARFSNLYTEIMSRLAFIESEILDQSEETLREAIEKASGCKNYLKDLLRTKPHRLSAETERALSALSPAFRTPYEAYNMAKLADMKFGSFTVNGKEYPLGYSLFEDDYEYESDTEVRRTAFRKFSEKLREYENVTGAVYNANVRDDCAMAKLRGFPTVFDSLLFDQKVTMEMYHRQIDVITEKLAPHMRRYARLLKAIHRLPEMTFADLKLAVDPSYDPRVTIEESKTIIKEGLSVMGSDYLEMIDRAYRERWMDFAKNQGKSTGGFCSSPYGANSFILLSWNDRMADVFTLAHELGHAGHALYTNRAQSVFDAGGSTYFIEAPSTMNELLLANHLLRTKDDPRFRRWVLSSMITNTYYHNFVTHLREAWYQREVYRIVSEGSSVNAETLSAIFRKNLELFWGDGVKIIEGAELTWMRQPHYYMGLYSYTYSAGLTIATEVASRIEREGQCAVDDWKKVLSAGGTMDPTELAAMAGVDITTDAPLLHTIEKIGSMIDEICRLTEEIDGVKVS